MEWFVETLKAYPQLGIFLALAVGFLVGPWKLGGFSLGNVTATLLAGVAIGQLGLQISPDLKNTFFLLFLFAVGFGVGPQFMRGLRTEGPRQIGFALLSLVFCLVVPWLCAVAAGLPLGFGAGMYAGSQTISAAIGVATDQIHALGLDPEQAKALASQIPIAYAVTYIFGTIGSAIVLAKIGPRLIGVNLQQACREYEAQLGAGTAAQQEGVMSSYRSFDVRAYRVDESSGLVGRPVADLFQGAWVFVERVRRDGNLLDADGRTVLQAGDVVAISGSHEALVEQVGQTWREVEDVELLSTEVETVDVFVNHKDIVGKTLAEIGRLPWARGVYVRKIVRSMVEIPILPNVTAAHGDIVTLVGRRLHVEAAVRALGFADRSTETTDIAYIGWGIFLGGLAGVLSLNVGGIPLSLSTSGGALLAGLVLGWLRSSYPAFGNVPGPALWVMNTLGLNVFIAAVGITAGPGFVAGLEQVGISLFLWGAVATVVPLLATILIGHFLFKLHPAILFGACAGVRTTTAALGMIQEEAKSKVPALGYGMPYAVGNTLLTIFGLVIVILLAH